MKLVAANRLFACALFAALTGNTSHAQAQQAPPQNKPFAEHKVDTENGYILVRP
jgi:hypothetical protein